jgi:hypothetical protein
VIDLRMAWVALRVRWEWLRQTAPNSSWARLLVRRDNVVAGVVVVLQVVSLVVFGFIAFFLCLSCFFLLVVSC